MKEQKFKNVEIGLNYSIIDTNKEDVIYIETLGKYDFETGSIIAVTVDEAKWLSEKLLEYVKEFEKSPKYKAKKLIEETENTLKGETNCWQDNQLYEFIGLVKELTE